jgi:hypothetical protein
MIFSKKHRFIFIKGRKVAGTSVEIALSTICGPEDILTPIGQADEVLRTQQGAQAQNYSPDREAERAYIEELKRTPARKVRKVHWPKGTFEQHMTLVRVLELCGDVRGEYRVVAIDRNPYSKVLSLANMQAATDYKVTGVMTSTPEALQDAIKDLFATGAVKKLVNIKQYRGPDGKLAAHVMRYENLADDFADFMKLLGITDPPVLPHAKKGLLADQIDPRDLLSKQQIETINTLFAAEFEEYGYPRIQVA